jgi:hypothetical protein
MLFASAGIVSTDALRTFGENSCMNEWRGRSSIAPDIAGVISERVRGRALALVVGRG